MKTEMGTSKFTIHGEEDFAGMRAAGQVAAETLDYITPYIVPGVTTEKLDNLCADFIKEKGGISAPLGYRGYPKSVCISINHVVCHGIPDDRKLKDGDVINIDVTPIINGWYGDSSRMYYVGKPSVKAKRLVEVTYECLMRAIDIVKPGVRLGDIGYIIQEYAEKQRFSVVRDFCGHGLGTVFHEPPNVMHYGNKGQGDVLEEGVFFTIEPMINAGKKDTKILSDGWTAVTRDRSLSAQFEHSIGITADGCEIFTFSPKGFTLPPYE
ncbi:MAG: type I methionyl aminopeptidase [Alphaproteobacteria bacterium]|nr:type I methionyl aminopeptidase [Alphaproteobacteria bacterium]